MATFGADELLAEVMERDPGFRQQWDRLALARQVAALVLRYRVAHGLTQTALAQRLGVTQSAVARLESGEVNPAIETLQRLSHRLNLPISLQIRPRPVDASPAQPPSDLVLVADVPTKAPSPAGARPGAAYRGGGGAGGSLLPAAARPSQAAGRQHGAPASATKAKRGPHPAARSGTGGAGRRVAATSQRRAKERS